MKKPRLLIGLLLTLILSVLSFTHPTNTLAVDSSGTWVQVGSLATPRFGHALGVLQDGRVILAGGFDHLVGGPWTSSELTTVTEIYNPTTQTWSSGGNLNTGRAIWQWFSNPNLITLSNGKVLVANGENPVVTGLSEAEVFDPSTNNWSVVASTNTARYRNIIELLPSGKVLSAAGSAGGPPL